MGGIIPMDWFPEEVKWSGCRDAPIGFNKDHRGVLPDVDGDPPLSHPPLYVAEI
jgi:hypothetical protein